MLIQNSIEKSFSNPNFKDRFIISITGKTIVEGEMLFQIVDSKGEQLFVVKHPSNYLIGFGIDYESTIEEKENYIKKRVMEFFNDNNFFEPAISADEEYDKDYSNKKIWHDIKSDSTSVGFYYLVGIENGCRISFSKKEKKVMTYFCCC